MGYQLRWKHFWSAVFCSVQASRALEFQKSKLYWNLSWQQFKHHLDIFSVKNPASLQINILRKLNNCFTYCNGLQCFNVISNQLLFILWLFIRAQRLSKLLHHFVHFESAMYLTRSLSLPHRVCLARVVLVHVPSKWRRTVLTCHTILLYVEFTCIMFLCLLLRRCPSLMWVKGFVRRWSSFLARRKAMLLPYTKVPNQMNFCFIKNCFR